MSVDAAGATSPLPQRKSPVVAALWGASLGALGMALYFRNWRDMLLPGIPAIAASIGWPGGLGFWMGQAFCAAYGAARIAQINARLDATDRAKARADAMAMIARPPLLVDARPVVIEAIAVDEEPADADAEPTPVPAIQSEELPPVAEVEPTAPELPAIASDELPEEVEPAPPSPSPSAPKRRGRPKGSGKLAA